MNQNKLIQVFLKRINSPVNINGLMLYPQVGDDTLKWELKNPNDVSYSTYVVEGHIEELVYEFMEMTGTKDNPLWKDWAQKYCRLTHPKMYYINNELRAKINKSFENLKTIVLVDDGKTLKSDCYVIDWKINYPDSEALYIYVSMELSNPKIDGKDIDDDTLQEFIQEFTNYSETAAEQEMDVIWESALTIMGDKNMFDDSYMFSTAVIGYFDSFGNPLT